MTAPHPSLPRRPARTSQRDDRRSIEFSRTPMREPGVERTIRLLHYPGKSPVVAIQLWRELAAEGRILLFAEDAAVVVNALTFARDPFASGRSETGSIPMGKGGSSIHVFARVDSRGPRVLFGRVGADGEYLGRPTTITGDELDALERAVRHLTEIAS